VILIVNGVRASTSERVYALGSPEKSELPASLSTDT